MFKFTQANAGALAAWDDEDAEQFQVQYNDGGLQQQLAAHLQNNKADRPRISAAVSYSAAHAQHTLRRHASPPSQSPRAADVHALIGDLQHLTQATFRDVQQPTGIIQGRNESPEAGPLLNSAAAVLDTSRQLLAGLLQEQQHPPQRRQHGPQRTQQQPQQAPAVRTTTGLTNPWSQQHPQHEQEDESQQQQQHQPQLPDQQPHRLQQQQLVQEHQKAPASLSQLLAPQQQKPAAPKQPQQQRAQQQRRKSILYSTPQQQAPKKKPRFSIKDTHSSQTVFRTPATAARPDAVAGTAAAAAATAAGGHQGPPGSQAAGLSGPSALAALLGSNSAVTPARQKSPHKAAAGVGRTGESMGAAGAAEHSKTPGSSSRKGGKTPGFGVSGLYPTPRLSTNKGSRVGQGPLGDRRSPVPDLAAAAAAGVGGTAGEAARPVVHDAAAAAAAENDDADDLTPVPAALFQDEGTAAANGNMQQQPAAAAAAEAIAAQSTAGTPAATRVRRSSVATPSNPLLLMQEQRQRQAQFLSALPAAAAANRSAALNSNAGMLSCLAQSGGCGVPVPAGSSLSKIVGQIVAAQKEQQEQLQQQTAEGAAGPSAAAGHLELEVVSKHWEAHMVKCICTITQCQQQQQGTEQATQHPPQQQQQQQHRLGERVYLFLASKTALSVDLDPGHRVEVHHPWYDVTQQATGQPAVILAYLLSSVS